MTRALAVLLLALSLVSCASTDRDAPRAVQPWVNGDDTPAPGTGIQPNDSGLGLMPGFPVGRR